MARSQRSQANHQATCCDQPECCTLDRDTLDRRLFVKWSGASLAVLGSCGTPSALAGPFSANDTIDHFVPLDKKLQPDWVQSLFARGERTWYRGDDLKTIGMPVGGLCAGQVYLTGDGRLVYWGIFNQQINTGYGSLNYQVGRLPTQMVIENREVVESPAVDQGFVVRAVSEKGTAIRTLDRAGFPEVRFCGEYPIGYVDYASDDFPVAISLEAFSPFIPLNAEDSALPATILCYKLENVSSFPLQVTLAGLLQNSALYYNQDRCIATHRRINTLVASPGIHTVLLGTKELPQPTAPEREPIVFADFENSNYGAWQVEGEAFGAQPAAGTLANQQPVVGFRGKGLVNTYLGGSDQLQGKLTSPEFTIERPYISFLIGGGSSEKTSIHLLVDGQIVKQASGRQAEQLVPYNWSVSDWIGKKARIEIVDEDAQPWGHINIDHIEFRDTPLSDRVTDARKLPDYGTLALSLLGDEEPLVSTSIPQDATAREFFTDGALANDDLADRALDAKHRAALARTLDLQPGEESSVTFVISWHMPNLYHGSDLVQNHYAKRFDNAAAVARYIAENQPRLTSETQLWHDTYYDSTLPHWLLDRLHSTVANLASETCQWWGNGRFWAYEGCGCCHGTCGHVWNYEHAMARLFPELERSVRELQDFAPGVGFVPATGEIRFRGENWDIWAGDSQGGYVLKAYREHQVSSDASFLRRTWPAIRKATQFLIAQDNNGDGLIEGQQHQTYDQNYFGANTMVGSLYLAALRAAEEMARELGDASFANRCAEIFKRGATNSVDRLFNGEYFVQQVDLQQHPEWQYADGCLADQLFGQGWAHQIDLGYIYPQEQVRKTLESIWKYCWAPDVGLQNEKHTPERWFAYPGEAGLFTCTWPKSKHLGPKSTRYRNEIWTGIEYQVANHMAYEGMLTEALAICRAIHDRYHPSKHNPFNEIECGDHYARAMASWGVLLGLSGFQYHGPRRHIGFLPRFQPDHFRCVFTTADGWGTFEQRIDVDRQWETLAVKWGAVPLATLLFELPVGKTAKSVQLTLQNDRGSGEPSETAIEATLSQEGRRLLVTLAEMVTVVAGRSLSIEMAY